MPSWVDDHKKQPHCMFISVAVGLSVYLCTVSRPIFDCCWSNTWGPVNLQHIFINFYVFTEEVLDQTGGRFSARREERGYPVFNTDPLYINHTVHSNSFRVFKLYFYKMYNQDWDFLDLIRLFKMIRYFFNTR